MRGRGKSTKDGDEKEKCKSVKDGVEGSRSGYIANNGEKGFGFNPHPFYAREREVKGEEWGAKARWRGGSVKGARWQGEE